MLTAISLWRAVFAPGCNEAAAQGAWDSLGQRAGGGYRKPRTVPATLFCTSFAAPAGHFRLGAQRGLLPGQRQDLARIAWLETEVQNRGEGASEIARLLYRNTKHKVCPR